MIDLLLPQPQVGEIPALSALEEGLQGPHKEQVREETRQRLQALALQLQKQMHQGTSPAEFREISAVQDACMAALELIDSV